MPKHGELRDDGKICHVAVPLKQVQPIYLKVVPASKPFFFEMSAALQFVLVPKVSRLRKGGKKRNGATIFTGTRVFKAWSCLRRCPIR